jgi:uncharacterized protein (DUF433 family)
MPRATARPKGLYRGPLLWVTSAEDYEAGLPHGLIRATSPAQRAHPFQQDIDDGCAPPNPASTELERTHRMPDQPIDWSQCEDVESVPGRVSGAWVIKGTRVPAQVVLDNARAGCSAEEIATEIFELPIERVRGVLRFAKIAEPSNG